MDIFKKFTARAVKLVSGRASAALFCDYAYANEMKTPVHPGYGRGSRNRGALEMEYAADGPEKAEEKIFKTGNTDPKGVQNIHVWYPASMEEGKKYPLLIISNGMEFSCTSFIAILQHLASWGFIAAGNDALNSGSGETAAKTLEKMLSENEKQGSLSMTASIWITSEASATSREAPALSVRRPSRRTRTITVRCTWQAP